MCRNKGKMFLLPFRENVKILQDRFTRRGCVRTVGPTVFVVGPRAGFQMDEIDNYRPGCSV